METSHNTEKEEIMARRAAEQANFKIESFFKAKNLMSEVKIFKVNEFSKIKDYLKNNNYDLAVLESANNYSYVFLDDIGKNESLSEITAQMKKSIGANQRVDLDSSIETIINKFKTYKYLFVFNKASVIKGLITYADLNKAPVYAFCYIIISKFEKTLRIVVKKRFKNDGWLIRLSDEQQKQVGGIYISEKARGVELSLLSCTTICHLQKVLQKQNSWINSLSSIYESKRDFKLKMDEVIEWRNKIMHNRDLISDINGGKKLFNFINNLGQQMKVIQRWIRENES